MPNILVVDDHPLVRQGVVRVLLDEYPKGVMTEASNAPQTMEAVWNQPLDLVILDLSLPGRGGLELLKEIKTARPGLPVLIFSGHPEDQFAIRVLKAGAAGYLAKDSPPALVIQAVRLTIAGKKFISAATAEHLATDLTVDSDKLPHELLSDREYDILLRIASGQTVGEIAATLNLSVKTVSTYRTRILQKMGKQNNSELIQYAIRAKLVE